MILLTGAGGAQGGEPLAGTCLGRRQAD